MNKVMQAAGRVIRTGEDRGIILLLDDRFLRPEVQGMFPREWSEYAPVTRNTVAGCLSGFGTASERNVYFHSMSINCLAAWDRGRFSLWATTSWREGIASLRSNTKRLGMFSGTQ